MYPLAKILIVPLHALHITPNMITIFNILVGAATSYCLLFHMWLLAVTGTFVHQLLDAMDGTMARTYGLTSEFGAKLDEYTDIVFGVLLGCSALGCAWPNPVACVFLASISFLMLFGELNYANAQKRTPVPPRYVEELSFFELVGLWGIENMTYNMWAIALVLYASTEAEETMGWMQDPVDFVPSLTLQIMVVVLGGLAIALSVYMKSQAAQTTPPSPTRPTAPVRASLIVS